jgi:hypothetical protein
MESAAYRIAMREVSHSLNNAVIALDQCEFSGPCREAATRSRIGLIKELSGVE